jgi:predicted GNAT family acetyltransferase
MTMNAEVRDNPAQHRFELPLDGDAIAAAYYRIVNDRLLIVHTEVPRAFSGKGIGTEMMKGVGERLRESGRKAAPVCSFAVRFFNEHPEYADVLA